MAIFGVFEVFSRLEQGDDEGIRTQICLFCRQSRQKEAVLRPFMKITLEKTNHIQTIKTEKV